MKKIILFSLLLLNYCCFSQEVMRTGTPNTIGMLSARDLEQYQQPELQSLVKELYAAKTDAEKTRINKRLLRTFEGFLQVPISFEINYDSLKKDIQLLRAPDNSFRIINWHVEKSDGTFEYYGFIQSKFVQYKKHGPFRKIRIETMQLYPLMDKSAEIKNPDNAISDNKKWYGMRYYRIIESKTKTRNYYTLLGWDGNDKFSQKKIIDVLSFDNNGVPHFGADIFNFQKRYPKRVIFEYSATCTMPLKYSEKKDSIIFGHLAPIQPQLEGQFQYYCTDMSYDGFGFRKGKWNYGADIKATNDKDEKDKLYHDPHDRSTGSDKSQDYKTVMETSAPTGDGNKVKKRDRVKKPKQPAQPKE